MGVTSIEWCGTEQHTGYTFNPWIGCNKVSIGCRNCYAEVGGDPAEWPAELRVREVPHGA